VRVVRVLAPNPSVYTLEGTNTWIVGADPSIVIDPGPNAPAHIAEVRREAGRVGAIVLTHGHEDHAPGAAPLAEATGAPVFAFRPPEGGQRVRDGQPIRFGDVPLVAVHTPGHAPDHVAYLLEVQRVLFTGDAVLGRGTSLIDPPEGDLGAYLRSLRRMREMDLRTIYPGHGPIVLDARAKLDEYIEHRSEREAQVLSALSERDASDGPTRGTSIGDLVEAIYSEYPSEVRPLAARSVLAHLLKLEAEGKVARRGSGEHARFVSATPRSCERCGRAVGGRARLCDRCRLAALQERPGD
jgi:glyoxylase-like metal-dependent hydrolase (beta-lactamase superfamily II)